MSALAPMEDQVRITSLTFIVVGLLLILTGLLSPATAQQLSKDRELAQTMLQTIASDIKQHYYDPKFHGLDWDAIVADAKQKIDKSENRDVTLLHIAAAIEQLDDSHTFLMPPRAILNAFRAIQWDWRARFPLMSFRHNYGWTYEIIGERSFVTHVRPGSDAEKKRLHAGDEILSINGYHPERATIEKFEYVFNILRPQSELKLEVVDPNGIKRDVTVAAARSVNEALHCILWEKENPESS